MIEREHIMFEFKDLDRMGRETLLNEQKATVDYWRAVHRLTGLFAAFGKQTGELIAAYNASGGTGTIVQDLAKVQFRGEVTTRKLRKETERIDTYLRELDARLADGSKWYTAQEIADMILEHPDWPLPNHE